jgi:hypothetical protein
MTFNGAPVFNHLVAKGHWWLKGSESSRGGTGAANGNGKQQHASRDSLAEEKAFATLGIRGVPSRQMHADRRYGYVRCTVDWARRRKGKTLRHAFNYCKVEQHAANGLC